MSENKNMPNEKETMDKKVLSITEAAELNSVTRQAIYVAIKFKKLKAKKKASRWQIRREDLDEYRKNKYSRAKSMYKGRLLFDNDKGCYSIKQTAGMLGVPAQKIYYATRSGQLKAARRGAAWVIRSFDIEEYRTDRLNKRKARKRKEKKSA